MYHFSSPKFQLFPPETRDKSYYDTQRPSYCQPRYSNPTYLDNRKPLNDLNHNYDLQKAKQRIQELQCIINDIQNYSTNKSHLQDYRTQCHSRPLSQNRPSSPFTKETSTNHILNQPVSPISSHIPERSRVLTPPPEENHHHNHQDLFTKYINQMNNTPTPHSPRFNTPLPTKQFHTEKKTFAALPVKTKPADADLILTGILNEDKIEKSLDNYKLGKVLGLGSYAVVRIAQNVLTSQRFAIKTYEKSKLIDPQKRKNVTREIKILSKLRHANIIKLLSASESISQLHLVMEYTTATSMNTFIKSKPNRKLDEEEVKLVLLLMSIQRLKSYSSKLQTLSVHRDIKLENILVDDKMIIKLIDFGFSIAIDPQTKLNVFCGTPSYMAPEIVNKLQYSFPADIWALGILFFKMLTGSFPFRGCDDKELYRRINSGKIEFPTLVSTQAKSLVQKLLRINQKDRPTAKEVNSFCQLNHQILQDEYFT